MRANKSDPSDPVSFAQRNQSLHTQLKLLMLLRVVTVTILLGVTTYLQWRQGSTLIEFPLKLLYGLCAFSYFLTLGYAFALVLGRKFWLQAYVQLVLDTCFVGALIYITSGYDIFPFLFLLTIINSSIILGRKGALFLAVLSGLIYGGLLELHFYQVIPTIGGRSEVLFQAEELIEMIFYNFAAFFVVALLSGSLSEELKRVGRKLEQKQTDLLDLENLNRNIVESLPSGLITINTEGRITSFNKGAEEITGLAFSEVFNQPIADIFSSLHGYPIDSTDEKGRRWEDVFQNPRDRKNLVLGFSCSPLRHHKGRLLGQIVNFQDVTSLKQMQEQIRQSDKLAAMGRLAASIAHEIRNPLASISGSIQILKEDLKPVGQNRTLMDIVNRETNRLNQLIQEFLEFAKPGKSRSQVIPLVEVIRETVEAGKQQLAIQKNKSIEINLELGSDPVWVRVDPGKLRQVLWNLLLNAFQAIQKDKGSVWVRIMPVAQPDVGDRTVTLEIQDNGCGIAEKDLEFIFEPFFTTKPQGTGMGLATVRRILEESGWKISLESRIGEGTCFKLLIPVDKPPSSMSQNLEKAGAAGSDENQTELFS